MAKCIALTRSRFTIVDDEDYDWLVQYRWVAQGEPDRLYARSLVDGKWVSMHRLILGDPAGLVVDHINRNPRDNRRCNLRAVSKSVDFKNRTPSAGTGLARACGVFLPSLWFTPEFDQYIAHLEERRMLAALPADVRAVIVLPSPENYTDRRLTKRT